MHSQSRFPLVLFFSLLAFLLAAAFISCKTEEESRTVEISSSSTSNTTDPVTCTVKEADYILHYQQKILTDDDGAKYVTKESEGFELAEYEDRSKTKVPNNSDEPVEPVKAGTEFKDLAKDYKGFSYSYAIQVDSTVYIYYTRNTVKYTFYNNSSEVFKVAATLSGIYGTACKLPTIKIGGKLITQWNERSDGTGTPFTKEFKSKDTTFFPCQTKDAIGTKIRPTALGDIVFCDGTAASMVELKAAKGDTLEKYKKNAIAVIVFDKYDTATGSTTDGNKLIGVGIQALNKAAPESGEAYKSLFHKIWRFNKSRPNPYNVVYICQSYHGYYDLCDIQNLYGSFGKTTYTGNSSSETTLRDSPGNDWTAIKNAMDYGDTLKDPEKGNMDLTDELLEGWYLPNWHELGLLMATDYKYNTTLYSACDALGIARPEDTDNFWVTSSKLYTKDGKDYVYAAFINPANSYTSFTALVSDDTTYWQDCDEKCQILPFRVFK